ncbi:MAG: DUF2652 domain-containing protein [Candidatus Promineifilaceae bacterium]|jgi:hypothetical protein
MSQNTYTGFLVVGDISGYTSYVATTELAHSQEVLAELLELIVHHIRPVLTLVRLEGDAVFAHVPAEQISRGESLIEVLETTYTAFRDHVRGIVQRTTCECNACRAIPTLDLKFIVHYGDYMMQEVSGIHELVGSEVNRLFRLTKNHVTQETGWNAYILCTAVSLRQLGLPTEGMREFSESYEHLGEVTVYASDLHARFEEIAAARHIVLKPEEIHGTLQHDFAAPPAVVWEWLNDPVRRTQVQPENRWSSATRPGGRTGAGARNHCAHGKDGLTCETILDWRPFDYVTSIQTTEKMPYKLLDQTTTIRLEPIGDGQRTRVYWDYRMERLPGFIARVSIKQFLKMFRQQYVEPLAQLIAEDQAKRAEAAAGKVVTPVKEA